MGSVFEKLGGVRAMARRLGVPPSTVMSWKRKRLIPTWRHRAIIEAAREAGVFVNPRELRHLPPVTDADR
jgi:DNA-binding transcriptional regulator YdaS (Cro superfamily)